MSKRAAFKEPWTLAKATPELEVTLQPVPTEGLDSGTMTEAQCLSILLVPRRWLWGVYI